MALKLLTVASSSKGNCLIIKNDSTTLLVDIGVSLSRLKTAFDAHRINLENIDGILITHEHSDHISGLKCFLKHYNIPVYAHRDTMNIITKKSCDIRAYDIEETGFSINNIDIQPFRTRHDAVYSLGYSFIDNSAKISIATDLGCMTRGVMNNLYGSDIVLIESNHDENMLKQSFYPEHVKKRILSNVGHLSNNACAEAVLSLADRGTRTFILGHLSDNNNTRRLAYNTTTNLLKKNGFTIGHNLLVDVAAQSLQYESYFVDNHIERKKII